MTELNCSR